MFPKVNYLAFVAVVLFCVNVNAKVVTEKIARNVAESFMASKGLADRKLVPVHNTTAPQVKRTPSVDAQAPAYHIFTDQSRKSIIVVSGDDLARPILGYSFDTVTKTDGNYPPAMMAWLNDMEKQIVKARESGLTQDPETAGQWASAGNPPTVLKQLTTAQWGLGWPYWGDCPFYNGSRCVTGCVATSYAILMKYYGYPANGRGIAPGYVSVTNGIRLYSRNINHPYDWDSMPLVYDNSSTAEQGLEVSRLMADIGVAIMADYGTPETYANYNKAALFAHFGYSSGLYYQKADYTANEWCDMLRSRLDDNRPILYNAKLADESGAHSFIIDGYAEDDYFCVNWGWDGSCNGLYTLDAMVPYATADYNGAQAAYLDFRPAEGLPVTVMVNDSIGCPSIETAVGLAPFNGQPTKLTMVSNSVTSEVIIRKYQNVILDLNGYNLDIMKWGLYNYGELTITDSKGTGKMTVTTGNTSILNNYGQLSVQGGEYVNNSSFDGSGNDYRRCIWTDAASITNIADGTFSCVSQVICSNGKLTIDNGQFDCTGTNDVILNFSTNDSLIINGGTFNNNANQQYGRVVWTTTNTTTLIKGGTFTSMRATIWDNGDMTIDNGRFICKGNYEVICNNIGTMTINGGTIRNQYRTKSNPDYRRAFYASAGTFTHITGGDFNSDYQTLTFVGTGIIDGGTIQSSGSGLGCLSGGEGNVTINYCRMNAGTLVVANGGGSLKCYGGIYSGIIADQYLGKNCKCQNNDDIDTKTAFPYKVVNLTPNGIDAVYQPLQESDLNYDLKGIMRLDNDADLHIIRSAEGKTIKVLYK